MNKSDSVYRIVKACEDAGLDSSAQIAYVLATVDHETAGTFKPVREAYWLSDPDAYLKRHHPEYYPYYGRGLVQITWDRNYKLFGERLGLDLIGNPDLALDFDTALRILIDGFKFGLFTGRKLGDYVNADHTDFVNARRCINGTDKAHKIADIAREYLAGMAGKFHVA